MEQNLPHDTDQTADDKGFCHIAEEILLWRHLFDKLFVFFFGPFTF